VKDAFAKPRLCWTRRELVEVTGLSYRSIQNLEARGLLRRCLVGVTVACYTDASVRALFAEQPASNEAANEARPGTLTPLLARCLTNRKQN
jgi:hypothetical protein